MVVKSREFEEFERKRKLTLCGHQVFVGFASKDGEEVEDVEKEILVRVGHRVNEPLVCRDDCFLIDRLFG